MWETAPPPSPAPTQRIAAVYSEVEKLLVSGQLSTGDAEGLIAKLDSVARAIATQETPSATKILTATANQVGALLKSRRITQATADSLRNLLTAAISSL